jgi:signal transduction histidine kinase
MRLASNVWFVRPCVGWFAHPQSLFSHPKGTTVRIAEFIVSHMDSILADWEVFASTRLPAAREMSPLLLRDHAREILEAVARDLSKPQTAEDQSAKSMGLAVEGTKETAAQTHGFLRAQSGFDINQMASEYRALRANVLRLWMRDGQPQSPDLHDLIRFNEAIDQAVAESVAFFSDRVDQARNLFLGMLGHDMRTPLQAIQMTAVYLEHQNAGDNVSRAVSRLTHSAARMKSLLDDLVAYNRANLGQGIPIRRSDVDAADLVASEVDEIRAAHPDCHLNVTVAGDTRGSWDGVSVQRLLGNLVVNAIKYGQQGSPVRILLTGESDQLRFEVRNKGTPIPESEVERLFRPLERGDASGAAPSDGSFGLGLYIAREIAKAHGGELGARREDVETVFAGWLPRQAQQAA